MGENNGGTDCAGHASWQEITDLVVVEDSMLDGRVRLFLGVDEKGHSHSAPEGILANLFKREIRNYLRRFTFVRIVLAVAQEYPQVSHSLSHRLVVLFLLFLCWLLQVIGNAAAVAWQYVLHDEACTDGCHICKSCSFFLAMTNIVSCAAPVWTPIFQARRRSTVILSHNQSQQAACREQRLRGLPLQLIS